MKQKEKLKKINSEKNEAYINAERITNVEEYYTKKNQIDQKCEITVICRDSRHLPDPIRTKARAIHRRRRNNHAEFLRFHYSTRTSQKGKTVNDI